MGVIKLVMENLIKLIILRGTSYKIGKQRFYAKGSLAFNNRSNGFSDEYLIGFETGTQLFKDKLLLLTRLNTTQSLYNGSLSAANSNGSIFANNIEIVGYSGEINYFLNKK